MTTLFRAKPRFLPFCFASVVGVCGGAVAGVFGSLKFFFAGQWEEGFPRFILAPVQTIQFTVLAAVSFPLFPYGGTAEFAVTNAAPQVSAAVRLGIRCYEHLAGNMLESRRKSN